MFAIAICARKWVEWTFPALTYTYLLVTLFKIVFPVSSRMGWDITAGRWILFQMQHCLQPLALSDYYNNVANGTGIGQTFDQTIRVSVTDGFSWNRQRLQCIRNTFSKPELLWWQFFNCYGNNKNCYHYNYSCRECNYNHNNVICWNYSWKNGFVTATRLGTTNEFFVVSTKKIAAASKRFDDITKHFVVVTKYFCYPYFNKLMTLLV